ncbi:MAG: VPLPA-CTERM sorting domain-containing protein [Gammaproteobacteria bacterium]|jgi:hypothetical protein
MRRQVFSIPFLVVSGFLHVTSAASAAIVQYEFSDLFSDGAVAPTGPAPWVRATFDDSFGDASTVRLSIDALGTLDEADVTQLYFNLNPTISITDAPDNITVTPVGTIDFVGPIVTDVMTDGFKAGGDGFYDILIDMPPPPGDDGSRLNEDESLVFDIVRTDGVLSAPDFYWLSTPEAGDNPGPFLAAVKLQVTGTDESGSAWVSATVVPLPAAGWLLISSLGLFGIAVRRRRAS